MQTNSDTAVDDGPGSGSGSSHLMSLGRRVDLGYFRAVPDFGNAKVGERVCSHVRLRLWKMLSQPNKYDGLVKVCFLPDRRRGSAT
jgi:hypothetical protein